MREVKLSNGKLFKVGMASFEDAIDLKDAVMAELVKIDPKLVDLEDLSLQKLAEVEIKGKVLETIIKAALTVDSSKHVREIVFRCMKSSTYDSEKITMQTFEKADVRPYYYKMFYETVKENLLPFFQNVVSILDVLKSTPEEVAHQK